MINKSIKGCPNSILCNKGVKLIISASSILILCEMIWYYSRSSNTIYRVWSTCFCGTKWWIKYTILIRKGWKWCMKSIPALFYALVHKIVRDFTPSFLNGISHLPLLWLKCIKPTLILNPDRFIKINYFNTPSHIEPEWYFLLCFIQFYDLSTIK